MGGGPLGGGGVLWGPFWKRYHKNVITSLIPLLTNVFVIRDIEDTSNFSD